MKIRRSTQSDSVTISGIHTNAFGPAEGPVIAELVHDLLKDETAKPLLSLVADADGTLAGHILFTAAHIQSEDDDIPVQILAPLAVVSECQGEGVGGMLIREGLRELAETGVGLVFVLGHPGYYPKFGFRPAGECGLDAPHPIPPEHADAWMVCELQRSVLGTIQGTVRCSEILNEPRYWQE